MAKYHGRRGVIYMSTTGSGTAVAVVGLNMWSLDMATDKVETSEFGVTNKTYVQGLPDVKGQISGFWDDTTDTPYDASQSADGVKLYLYPASSAATKYWYGPAWIDFNIETAIGDAVKIGASFVANGQWGQL